MAERINVTRQAVSRWETGKTYLAKQLAKYLYGSEDALLDFLIAHMPNPDNQSDSERRTLYDTHLSQLKHWK